MFKNRKMHPSSWNRTLTRRSVVIASTGCTEGIRCFSGAEPYQFRQRSTTNGRWERRLVCRKPHTSRPTEVESLGLYIPFHRDAHNSTQI
ncbi:hypothetical protein TNCT_692521 [Trichonephila clavata]|uniref:Uncharacterized protein n=1 Tax=Trichonephila clavata TaxID=2740835 RepID=A0A8X6KSP6_TRICU|nr:hypothetical protein TNCT_692521 [Trichonephila clavata]